MRLIKIVVQYVALMVSRITLIILMLIGITDVEQTVLHMLLDKTPSVREEPSADLIDKHPQTTLPIVAERQG